MIKIKKKYSFNVTVGDNDLGEFKLESEWEGFKKLVNVNANLTIITMNEHPTDFIDTIFERFGLKNEDNEVKDSIIGGSPSIVAMIREDNQLPKTDI